MVEPLLASGLDAVVDLALGARNPFQPSSQSEALLGAAGPRGGFDRRGLLEAMDAAPAFEHTLEAIDAHDPHPMGRMFRTETGRRAVSAVGNESLTLEVLGRLSLEVLAQAMRDSGVVHREDRLMVMPGDGMRPACLLRMSPKLESMVDSRRISDELDLGLGPLGRAMERIADPDFESADTVALRQVLANGVQGLAELFYIVQPEVILTRRPRMVPLCVPDPLVPIAHGARHSTAGIYCRDSDNEFGITACLHGTGMPDTEVLVAGVPRRVKLSNAVQDIVFIPLPGPVSGNPNLGSRGPRSDAIPAQSAVVHFNGLRNPGSSTRIHGTDSGLLRPRPSIQLKLQTAPDTDQGDSGCALIDQYDHVLGFAFERTDPRDYPQFTDWIWAANAMRALGLSPA